MTESNDLDFRLHVIRTFILRIISPNWQVLRWVLEQQSGRLVDRKKKLLTVARPPPVAVRQMAGLGIG